MNSTELHEDNFLRILWDDSSRIIGIDWKESTARMSDEDMKDELRLFAGYVEDKKATGIIVDVTRFRHRMSPEVQQWRGRNKTTPYTAAGGESVPFFFSPDAPHPSLLN